MDTQDSIGKAADSKARTAKQLPESRKETTKAANLTKKQMSKLPKSTHQGTITIGDTNISCFVLEDGRRVISGRALTSAIGMKGRGSGVSRIINHKLIKPGDNSTLISAMENPIKFVGVSPKGVDVPSDGYEATVLQDLCEELLKARDNGLLKSDQDKRYAQHADILIRGFARVGIIALVDEATGYQKDRAKDALVKILESFVAKEIQPYMKQFPADYYENLFRIRGLDYPPVDNPNFRPQYFGKLTNNIVYERLAPGVLIEIKKQAAKDEKKVHLHRRLTQEIGSPKLREHLASVITIMKLSSDYSDFMQKLNKIHPRFSDDIPLDLEETDR